MTLGTLVCREFCIAKDKQAARINVCTEQYFTSRSTGQDIHRFMPNIWIITMILILYVDQIIFIPLSHKRYFYCPF
jgi:hypothetical protein